MLYLLKLRKRRYRTFLRENAALSGIPGRRRHCGRWHEHAVILQTSAARSF